MLQYVDFVRKVSLISYISITIFLSQILLVNMIKKKRFCFLDLVTVKLDCLLLVLGYRYFMEKISGPWETIKLLKSANKWVIKTFVYQKIEENPAAWQFGSKNLIFVCYL